MNFKTCHNLKLIIYYYNYNINLIKFKNINIYKNDDYHNTLLNNIFNNLITCKYKLSNEYCITTFCDNYIKVL